MRVLLRLFVYPFPQATYRRPPIGSETPVVVETLKIRVKGSRFKGQRGVLRINTEVMRLRVKDPWRVR